MQQNWFNIQGAQQMWNHPILTKPQYRLTAIYMSIDLLPPNFRTFTAQITKLPFLLELL